MTDSNTSSLSVSAQRARTLIAFFSGTGGVSRVASAFHSALMEKGVASEEATIDARGRLRATELLSHSDTLLLLFPVYAFDAAGPVYEWLSMLGESAGKGKTAVVISVSGGGEAWPNSSCRANVISMLEGKGFSVAYERMIVMPSNCLVRTEDDVAVRLLGALPAKARLIVDEVLSGRRRRKRPGVFAHVARFTGWMASRGARRFGRSLKVSDACCSCGVCAKECPMENISMKEGRPVFANKCATCLHCVYRCPKGSLTPGSSNPPVFKEGFSLESFEKRMEGKSLRGIEESCKGFLKRGVRNYLLEKD